MSSKYTRHYLQNLRRESRKEWIQSLYFDPIYGLNVTGLVTEAAKEGCTSVIVPMFDYVSRYKEKNHYQKQPSYTKDSITSQEVISIFQEMFPDCKITYEEKWVQISVEKQELKKGICVDWS
jgi:hypothetical protein